MESFGGGGGRASDPVERKKKEEKGNPCQNYSLGPGWLSVVLGTGGVLSGLTS